MYVVVVFIFNDLRLKVTVHFLYIGGIVDHKLFKLSVSVHFRGHLNNELVYDDFICYINKRDRTQVLPTYEVFSHLYNKFT